MILSLRSRPLRERVYCPGHSLSQLPSHNVCSGRPLKYKNYDEEKLFSAYEDVIYKGLSIRRAAMQYGVPTTTLMDRVSGRVPFGKRSGPVKYLSDEEENELIHFVTECADVGYSYSRRDVIALVQDVLTRKGLTDVHVSHGWWEGFKKRHPELVLRKPEPLSQARAYCAKPEILVRYFQELESTLLNNDIMNCPSLIFNMDESGFPLDPKSPQIVCKRGQQHPSAISSGNKSQITVLACCNAAGYAIPPLVIFDRKILKVELTFGEVPETMYGLSSSGWIDSEIFDAWFQNHFLTYAPASRPLLLVLDGHSSHFNPATIRRAAEEKVILFCLPPNTTHKTQPLDKGCFGPLKAYWREECHNYLTANRGKVITRFQFSELFGRAWKNGMTMKNIIGGFKTTGIYPFNPDELMPEKPSSPYSPSSLCERTGLKYIPLFSPAMSRYRRAYRSQPESPDLPPTPELPPSNSPISDSPPPHLLPIDSQLSHLPPPLPINFSREECICFQRRKDEGYDLPGDKRYQLWLKQHIRHSTPLTEELSCESSIHLPRASAMSTLLSEKTREIKLPKMNQNTSARVLTSAQNLRLLEEKKKKKEEDLKAKEKRKLEREEKKNQKALSGQSKNQPV